MKSLWKTLELLAILVASHEPGARCEIVTDQKEDFREMDMSVQSVMLLGSGND